MIVPRPAKQNYSTIYRSTPLKYNDHTHIKVFIIQSLVFAMEIDMESQLNICPNCWISYLDKRNGVFLSHIHTCFQTYKLLCSQSLVSCQTFSVICLCCHSVVMSALWRPTVNTWPFKTNTVTKVFSSLKFLSPSSSFHHHHHLCRGEDPFSR